MSPRFRLRDIGKTGLGDEMLFWILVSPLLVMIAAVGRCLDGVRWLLIRVPWIRVPLEWHIFDGRVEVAIERHRMGEIVVPRLIKQLESYPDDVRITRESHVCANAARALGEIGREQPEQVFDALPALAKLVSHEDGWVRQRAVEALGVIAGRDRGVARNVAPNVVALLTDHDDFVKFAAAEAVGEIAEEHPDAVLDMVPALIELLSDEDKDVRASIASSLGKIGASEATEPLEPLLADWAEVMIESEQTTVGLVARTAIDEIRTESLDWETEAAEKELEAARNFGVVELLGIESVLADARARLDEAALNEALKEALAIEARNMISQAKEAARPDVSFEFSDTRFEPETWVDIEVTVENVGTAHAEEVKLDFPARVEVEYLTDIPLLRAGEASTLSFRLKPLERGKVPLTIGISFRDRDGKAYEASKTLDIDVGLPPSPPPGIVLEAPPEDLYRELDKIYADLDDWREGGMAWVYRATRRRDGRQVAIKVMKQWDADVSRSFMEEVFIWRGLDHPRIVKVLDQSAYPRGYLEMEYVPQSLEDLPTPMDSLRAAHLVFQIADAIKYSHSQTRPVLHLDLKPSNVRMDDDGVPKLADWGMAKILRMSRFSEGKARGYTAHYAAPEQIENRRVDQRTDIWQLGVIFYELVAGHLPFEASGEAALYHKILEGPPTPFATGGDTVEPIILRCLEKEPSDRYGSVAELQRDLAGVLAMERKETLHLTKPRMDKVWLCVDLVQYAIQDDNAERCLTYLADLRDLVKSAELGKLIEEEMRQLEVSAQQRVSIQGREVHIDRILHQARRGD